MLPKILKVVKQLKTNVFEKHHPANLLSVLTRNSPMCDPYINYHMFRGANSRYLVGFGVHSLLGGPGERLDFHVFQEHHSKGKVNSRMWVPVAVGGNHKTVDG